LRFPVIPAPALMFSLRSPAYLAIFAMAAPTKSEQAAIACDARRNTVWTLLKRDTA